MKEGGKKGIDLSGVADMGGVSFFNLAVESADGDMVLLEEVLKGANMEVDETAEERKGGAGELGKIFLSAGDAALAIIAHVPKALGEAKNVTVKEWVTALTAPLSGVEVVGESDEVMKVIVKADTQKGAFPLKMRDEAISAGVAFLRQKGLLPANDSSDDEVNYAEAAGVEW